MGALGVMTIISTVLGQLFHAVPPELTKGVPYDDYIAGIFSSFIMTYFFCSDSSFFLFQWLPLLTLE